MKGTLGGRHLIERTLDECVRSVDRLINRVDEMGEREMVKHISQLKANVELYQFMTGIEDSIEAVKEIFKKEEPTEE